MVWDLVIIYSFVVNKYVFYVNNLGPSNVFMTHCGWRTLDLRWCVLSSTGSLRSIRHSHLFTILQASYLLYWDHKYPNSLERLMHILEIFDIFGVSC